MNCVIMQYHVMRYDRSTQIQRNTQSERRRKEPIEGLHIGANRSSPVKDTAHCLGKIHYKIGNKLYIENSD